MLIDFPTAEPLNIALLHISIFQGFRIDPCIRPVILWSVHIFYMCNATQAVFSVSDP